ncbi:Catenin alpha-1 [Heterocephalus glaber]|uniref:Catenin alpha-1 n=1 Tax=Heterocephalus glaber TaxID=10181 RepID=G5BDV2_HETGA|nr:Catenin alpha-1 [Heterocephalus glaber]
MDSKTKKVKSSEEHFRPSLEESLESIISGPALKADLSCMRDDGHERIVAECNAVRQALQNLLSEYMGNAGRKERSDALNSAIDKMTKKTRDLCRQLQKAVMDHISDSFLETNVPLLVLIEAAKNGNEKEVKEYAQDFCEHANKLIENTSDVIRAAKKTAEAGPRMDKLGRAIADHCPDLACKQDLLAYLQCITFYRHQLNICSKVKAEVQNLGGELVVSRGDSGKSLIQAAKNLMNAIVQTVKASYVASTKYKMSHSMASLNLPAMSWKMKAPEKRLLVKREKQNETQTKIERVSQKNHVNPVQALNEFKAMESIWVHAHQLPTPRAPGDQFTVLKLIGGCGLTLRLRPLALYDRAPRWLRVAEGGSTEDHVGPGTYQVPVLKLRAADGYAPFLSLTARESTFAVVSTIEEDVPGPGHYNVSEEQWKESVTNIFGDYHSLSEIVAIALVFS